MGGHWIDSHYNFKFYLSQKIYVRSKKLASFSDQKFVCKIIKIWSLTCINVICMSWRNDLQKVSSDGCQMQLLTKWHTIGLIRWTSDASPKEMAYIRFLHMNVRFKSWRNWRHNFLSDVCLDEMAYILFRQMQVLTLSTMSDS